MAGVGAPVGKVRPVLTAGAENGSMRDGVSVLDDVVRDGARRMLAAALEAEVLAGARFHRGVFVEHEEAAAA
jgi:hypothetical protein